MAKDFERFWEITLADSILEIPTDPISRRGGEQFNIALLDAPALTGGDPALEALLAEDPPPPPAKCFVDDWASYASNEPTIYGNAAFVSVAAKFTGPPS